MDTKNLTLTKYFADDVFEFYLKLYPSRLVLFSDIIFIATK